MLQDLQQAVDYYQQALSVRGDFAGAWFNLGYVYELLADQQRALNAYDRAGELDQGFAAQAAQRRQGLTGSR
jgi:tetratricopeptide (TPR) repeat protein